MVLLPASSENNASQKIKKKEGSRKRKSWDTDQGALHTYKTGGSYKREAMYKRSFFFFALKCHASVLVKCTTSDASFSIQKTQIILPPEAQMFHNHRSFADSKPEC